MEFLQKIKKRITVCPNNPSAGHFSKETENTNSKKDAPVCSLQHYLQ